MQFQFSERIDTSTYTEFYNSLAIEGVQKIKNFVELNTVGNFSSKQFKYSFNNISWSAYLPLTTANLLSIQPRNQGLWLNIKYSKENSNSNIDYCYIIYDISQLPHVSKNIDI